MNNDDETWRMVNIISFLQKINKMSTTVVENKIQKKPVKKIKYNNLLKAVGIFKNDKISLSEIRKQSWR